MPEYTSLFRNVRSSSGFTMVELLLVISMLSLITALTFNTINYKKHQDTAYDSIRKDNIQKIVSVLESYILTEKRYPVDTDGDGIPSFDENPVLADYLRGSWPNDEPMGSYYIYWTNPQGTVFGLVVANSPGDKMFKYRSTWGQIKECDISALASDDGCL